MNCTSAKPYNCDATITFFLTEQQWTSDATTINVSFSANKCTQPPVHVNGLLAIWMKHGDLKTFIMTHQHTEARNHFPSKTRNLVRLCFSTHTEIHFDEHKSNYTLFRFTQTFFRPNKALSFAGKKLKSTYKSLEFTIPIRLRTVIYHTPKFYSVIQGWRSNVNNDPTLDQ